MILRANVVISRHHFNVYCYVVDQYQEDEIDWGSAVYQNVIVLSGVCCRVMREADANKLKLTPQFLELKFIEAIANNSKMFFGEKVRCRFPP